MQSVTTPSGGPSLDLGVPPPRTLVQASTPGRACTGRPSGSERVTCRNQAPTWLQRQEQQSPVPLTASCATDCSTGLTLPDPQHPAGATPAPGGSLPAKCPGPRPWHLARSPFAHLLPRVVMEIKMKSNMRKCSANCTMLYIGKVTAVVLPLSGDSS